MKNIYRLSMFCMVWALGAFAPLGAQTVVAWTDGASVSYSASSLVSLAACDSIVVSDSWKEADLQKLRAVVPTDEMAQLQKVNMSAASFSGDITLGMYSIFSHCLKLEEIVLPNTAQNSKVSLRCAFAYNPKLRRVANLENLQNITSLDTIFRNCPQLQSVAFSAGAPNTNEVKCTRAFEGCTALTAVDLSHFAGLSEGNNMFENCTNLERVRFAATENTQKNSFVERFKGCAKLQTIDNLDKFTNISAISGAFYGCVSLPAVTFCTTPQTMSGSGKEAFRGCEKLQSVANLTIFTNLSNCEAMFRECKLLESVNLPKNSAAKSAKQMFYKCDRLRTADLSMLTALTNFESAFNGCESLETVTLSAAEQAAATKFNSTFSGCKALRKVLNFSKYTQIDDLNNTFKQCAALDSVRFGCNPSAATNATTTFDDCKATCLKFMPCGTKKAASWQDKGTAKTASYNDSTFIYDIRTSDFALKKACDQFDWHGTTYTVSGDYAYTIIDGASNGCDSIDRLRLTICQSYNFSETKSVCDSLFWQGKWRTASGDYTEKYTTVHGCDSVYTLHLTVRKSTAATDVQTACDTFRWIDGATYTASNSTATHLLTNAAGCDSLVTLNLTLNRTQFADTTAVECASFVWHGKTYTQSGLYNDTISGGAACGCDSIIALKLTILPLAFGDTAAVAEGASFAWHGRVYTVAGEYRDTLVAQAANGCDSIVTLSLSFCESYRLEQDSVTCDSLLWQGKWRTASGDYTEKYTTAQGCDSLFVLHLTLIQTPQVVVPTLPTYCDRSASLSVAYELLAGQPDRYDLSFDESAQLAGFENVINAFLPPDVIAVTVPPDASEGDYAATLRIYNARATDGCASVSLPLAITVGFDAARYLVQKWNDVIVVNNSGDSDHPMRFVAYQWYKNGQKIADATRQHLYEAGGLDWNAVYTVDLTTEDGRTVRSCDFVPQQPQSVAPASLVVCPNPVAAFAPLALHLPDAVLSVSICNVQGVCVYRANVATDVVSPPNGFASGVYVVRAVTVDGQTFLAKIVVD